MELPGETYLFNLSLVAVTFTAVSALVMPTPQGFGMDYLAVWMIAMGPMR